MKKLFLFLTIATLSFISCSEDEETPSKDPIIGSWYITGEGFPECAKDYLTIFKDDGSYIKNDFEVYDGDCSKLNIINAKWENKDSSTYTLIINDHKVDGKVTFSNNNNTMTLEIDEKITFQRKN